jgi:hypothetical protein
MPQSPLLRWVLDRPEKWTMIELMWGRSFETPLFDFAATYEYDGKSYEGRGTSFDQDEALHKACGEALERWAMDQAGFASSNGLALHSCPETAERLARQELWERDAFLSRHLRRSQAWVAHPPALPSHLGAILAWLDRQGVECLYSQWESSGLFGAACGAWGLAARQPFGVVVGLGTGSTQAQALEKASIEAARNAAALLDGNHEVPLSSSTFETREAHGPQSHRSLALGLDYAQALLQESGARTPVSVLDPWKLEVMSHPIEGTPFYLARANDPSAQQLFWGPNHPEHIHPRILDEGLELSSLPHPVP